MHAWLASPQHSPYYSHMTITRGLRQAYDVQNLMHAALLAIQEQLRIDKEGTHESLQVRPPTKDEAAVLAALGKTWKDAQEQIRIHRGKPLPGSLTHEKIKRGPRAKALSAGLSVLADIGDRGDDAINGDDDAAAAAAPTCVHGVPAGQCALCAGLAAS